MGSGWEMMWLHFTIELIHHIHLQLIVKVFQHQLVLQVLHVLEGVPQLGGCATQSNNYEGDTKSLFKQRHLACLINACLEDSTFVRDEAISAWVIWYADTKWHSDTLTYGDTQRGGGRRDRK